MSKPNDGGPAFPRATTIGANGQPWNDEQPGMSLRAWMAGMAMQGLMSDSTTVMVIGEMNEQDPERTGQHIARRACELADFLIAELEKGNK